MVRVVKKDHTKEPFNIQKVVIAVNKSATESSTTLQRMS